MLERLPRRVKDLTGQIFGSLSPQYVLEINPEYGALWRCQCSCGGSHDVLAYHLLRGRSRYCDSCALSKRREQLAHARAAIQHVDGVVPRGEDCEMSEDQRRCFQKLLERRRRAGVTLTPGLIASCRNVARIEARQMARAA